MMLIDEVKKMWKRKIAMCTEVGVNFKLANVIVYTKIPSCNAFILLYTQYPIH